MSETNKEAYKLAEFATRIYTPTLAGLKNQTYFHKAVKLLYKAYKAEHAKYE